MQRQLDDAFRFSLRGHNDTQCDKLNVLIYFIFISLDIDECSADPSPCDENANCSNSKGSYSCTCRTGFTGDGKTCQGILLYLTLQKFVAEKNKIGSVKP